MDDGNFRLVMVTGYISSTTSQGLLICSTIKNDSKWVYWSHTVKSQYLSSLSSSPAWRDLMAIRQDDDNDIVHYCRVAPSSFVQQLLHDKLIILPKEQMLKVSHFFFAVPAEKRHFSKKKIDITKKRKVGYACVLGASLEVFLHDDAFMAMTVPKFEDELKKPLLLLIGGIERMNGDGGDYFYYCSYSFMSN